MRTKGKVIILFAITALFLAVPLAAQTASESFGASIATSNTKDATAGIFKTDVDNYMDVHKYSGILGDDNNWFSFVSNKSNHLNVGYARNFGSLYLGAWYQGRLFNIGSGEETVTLTPIYNYEGSILEQTDKTSTYEDAWINSANQIEFLLGIAGQGFRIGFYESLYTNKLDGDADTVRTVTEFLDGTVSYENALEEYTNNGGYIRPYIGWGTNIAVGDKNLRPYIDFGFTVYSDETIDNSSSYTTVNGVKQELGTTSTTIGAGNNSGYLMPAIKLGAKLDFTHGQGLSSTLGLEYGIDIRMYNNSYSASGVSGSVDGTVSWVAGSVSTVSTAQDTTTTSSANLTINERTNIIHKITPSYQLSTELVSGFRIGFSASLPISYRTSTDDGYNDEYVISKVTDSSYNSTTTGRIRTYNVNTETSVFYTGLNLGLGASYQLVPNRFTVNAGLRLTPLAYTNTVTTQIGRSKGTEITSKTVDQFGNVVLDEHDITGATGDVASDSVTVNSVWSYYSGAIAGGFVFYFTPSIALDMLIGAGSSENFQVDISTVNVLLTLKF